MQAVISQRVDNRELVLVCIRAKARHFLGNLKMNLFIFIITRRPRSLHTVHEPVMVFMYFGGQGIGVATLRAAI